MPQICGVPGCKNRAFGGCNKSFFRLPAIRSRSRDKDLYLKRRLSWLAALNRRDLNETKIKNLRICEDHFISGKPAGVEEVNNPDWIPSQRMKIKSLSKKSCAAKRKKLQKGKKVYSRKAADLKDVDNPDWIPSVNMGYKYKSVKGVTEMYIQAKERKNYKKKILNGRPANQYDIDNPDWVPSINLGYGTQPQKQVQKDTYISPHVEYLRSSVVSECESYTNETSNDQPSFSPEVEAAEVSDTYEDSENDSISYQNSLPEESTPSVAENSQDLTLPEACTAYNKLITSKSFKNDEVSSGEESDLSVSSELHQNVLSKKVQTDLTMIDLDKIAEAFRNSVLEVKKLKTKMNSLTEDILHLNEVYC